MLYDKHLIDIDFDFLVENQNAWDCLNNDIAHFPEADSKREGRQRFRQNLIGLLRYMRDRIKK